MFKYEGTSNAVRLFEENVAACETSNSSRFLCNLRVLFEMFCCQNIENGRYPVGFIEDISPDFPRKCLTIFTKKSNNLPIFDISVTFYLITKAFGERKASTRCR